VAGRGSAGPVGETWRRRRTGQGRRRMGQAAAARPAGADRGTWGGMGPAGEARRRWRLGQ
jgi:hypothetical protein